MRYLLLLALAGCYFRSSLAGTTRNVIETRRAQDIPSNVTGAMGLIVEGAGTTLAIRTTYLRTCYAQLIDVVEVRMHYERDFDIVDVDDAWAALFLVLLAPITIPISAALTPRDDEVKRELAPARLAPFPCPMAAPSTRVSIAFPSGARQDVITDQNGSALFLIPPGEPPCGLIVAQTGNVAAPPFQYGVCSP